MKWLLTTWLLITALMAQAAEIYFAQDGRVKPTSEGAAFVRRYEPAATGTGQWQVQDFYYPSGQKYSSPYRLPQAQLRHFVPTLANGELVLWYANGVRKTHISYRNGLPNGIWTSWHDNGQKSAQMPYHEGKLEGIGMRWYRSGQKAAQLHFVRDKMQGLVREWYADGGLETEITMRDNQPIQMLKWDRAGRLLAELHMDSQQRQSGVVLTWYPSGAKRSEALYQDDELLSQTNWDEEGNVLAP